MLYKLKRLFLDIRLKRLGGVQLKGRNILFSPDIITKSRQSEIVIRDGFGVRKYVILNVSSNGVLEIKENVFINSGTKINCRDKITVGKNVMLGQNVLIYDHDHDFRSDNRREKFVTAPVSIGDNVWIGSGVIILKGVSIGDNSVIAAGTVVRENVPANCVYYQKLGEAVVKSIFEQR